MSGAGLVITAILMIIIGVATGFTICAVLFRVESFNNDLEELNEELQNDLKREENLHKQLEEEKEERERK